MLLQNRLEHMRGKSVMVNGHFYRIGQDFVICDEAGKHLDVPEIDANKLLNNRDAWLPFDLTKTKTKTTAPTVERPKIQLITNTGDIIPPPPKMAGPNPTVQKSVESNDPPIPKGKEEWADPKPEYSLEWLQACAKAYKIRYKGKDKAALVGKIKAAMYD